MKSWKSETDDREKYGLYLASREWSVLKEAVHARAKGVCERCNVNKIDAVHHLTYIRKYEEQLDDLQGLCKGCHDFNHGKSDDDPSKQKIGFGGIDWIGWITLEDRPFHPYEVFADPKADRTTNPLYPATPGLVYPPGDEYDKHKVWAYPIKLSETWPNPLHCAQLNLSNGSPTAWCFDEGVERTIYVHIIGESELRILCTNPDAYANYIYAMGGTDGCKAKVWVYIDEGFLRLPLIKALASACRGVNRISCRSGFIIHSLAQFHSDFDRLIKWRTERDVT